jgi:tRNA/tmRNA/rRNA uracil-C5-methylase (TrmA/RlmC/RlmD family)
MAKRTPKSLIVTSDGFTPSGAAKCFAEGENIEVFGMLPGETAHVDIRKKKKQTSGVITGLITASPHRITPEELHYLSCSPWQVMEYPAQAQAKYDILESLFSNLDAPKAAFTPAQGYWGYRTKVEFSFTDRDQLGQDAPLSLAFNARGSGGKSRLALDKGCALLSENVNRAAKLIEEKLRAQNLTTFEIKTLILRESKTTGDIIATLYVKAEELAEFDTSDVPHLVGFHAWHSTYKSPASVPTRHLWSHGKETLTETIDGINLEYPWDGFFQNNLPVFEKALARMKEMLPKGLEVLELYSGVGTIGLALTKSAVSIHAVEINPSSVALANKNAKANGITNYTAEALPAEKIDADLIARFSVLILDPPRAGLHPKLIANILAAPPETIIYLSCNPETQARDWKDLAGSYEMIHLEGFDFYPQTPHQESLVVLKRR